MIRIYNLFQESMFSHDMHHIHVYSISSESVRDKRMHRPITITVCDLLESSHRQEMS